MNELGEANFDKCYCPHCEEPLYSNVVEGDIACPACGKLIDMSED